MMRRNIIRSIRIFCNALDGETHSECAVIHVPGKVKCELVTVVLPVILAGLILPDEIRDNLLFL